MSERPQSFENHAILVTGYHRVGSGLRDQLGVGPGDRVLLILLDGPEFAYTFFGGMKAVVYGDDRPFVSALLVPNMETLRAKADEVGCSIDVRGEFIESPQIAAVLEERVAAAMERFSRPAGICLLNHGNSISGSASGTSTCVFSRMTRHGRTVGGRLPRSTRCCKGKRCWSCGTKAG